jgi:hypothetical protein
MKTKVKVIKENPEYKVLINAVISRIGKESVNDVINHGIDGGFSGFVYYSDTHKFAMTYRKYILSLLNEMAECMGEEVSEMVSNFGVFRNSKMDKEDRRDLYRYLGGGRCEQCTITNLMAWFAAEEVCRMFDE